MSSKEYFDRELLSHFLDWKVLHLGFCNICRNKQACLDRALYDAGLGELNSLNDDGYKEFPEFIRRRAADKLGLKYITQREWFTGKTFVFGRR